MIGMSWGAAALDALGIHPPGLEAMAQAFWWPRYAEYGHAQGQLHLLDTGDFGGALGALSGFAWPAAHEGSAALQAWYDLARSTRDLARTPPPVADTGRALEAAPDLLDLARPGAALRRSPRRRSRAFFPDGAAPCCAADGSPEPPSFRCAPGRGSIMGTPTRAAFKSPPAGKRSSPRRATRIITRNRSMPATSRKRPAIIPS